MSSIEVLTFRLQPILPHSVRGHRVCPVAQAYLWTNRSLDLLPPHTGPSANPCGTTSHWSFLPPTAISLVQATITSHLDYCRSLIYGLPASFLPASLVLNAAARAALLHSRIKSQSAQPLSDPREWAPVSFLTSSPTTPVSVVSTQPSQTPPVKMPELAVPLPSNRHVAAFLASF